VNMKATNTSATNTTTDTQHHAGLRQYVRSSPLQTASGSSRLPGRWVVDHGLKRDLNFNLFRAWKSIDLLRSMLPGTGFIRRDDDR
jgi:hypothetical protein